MPTIEIRVTKAAQSNFLRSPNQSFLYVACKRLFDALAANRIALQVPEPLALDTFESDVRFLTISEPQAAWLTDVATAAGFASAGEFASRLLHAQHLIAEPTGAVNACIWMESPGAPIQVIQRQFQLRMGQRGRVLSVGNEEFLIRDGISQIHAGPLRLFRFDISATNSNESAIQALRQMFDDFAAAHLSRSDPLIVVRRVGRGPTGKSAKFRFEAVHVMRSSRPGDEGERRTHEFLLPVSHLREIDGSQCMPAWVLNKKLRERREKNEQWVEAVGLFRPPGVVLFEQFAQEGIERIETMRSAHAMWLADAPARAAAEEQQRLRNAEARQRAKEVAAEAAVKAAEREARLAAKRAARVPDLVLEEALVEWPEWIGPSSSRRRIDHRDQPCTVKFFGAKREITLPSGKMIVKMQGEHLRVFDVNGTRV